MVKASEAFSLLRSVPLGKGEYWDFYCLRSQTRKMELDGNSRKSEQAGDEGLALRFLKDGRMGLAFSAGIDWGNLPAVFEKARTAARRSSPDSRKIILAGNPVEIKNKIRQFNNFFPEPPPLKDSEMIKILSRTKNAGAAFSKKIFKVPRIIFEEIRHEIILANSLGFGGAYRKRYLELVIEAVARSGNQMCGSFALAYGQLPAELNPEKLGRLAAARAIRKLGGAPVPSGRYQILFEPEAGAMMLSLLTGALSGEEVMKNRSFLKNKIGRKIGSSHFTISDDGFLKTGLGSRPFDGEGQPAGKTVLFKNGVLKGFLHSLASAKYFKVPPTGNGLRSGYSGYPAAGPTNFYLEPGHISPEKLISGIDRGILATDLSGLHTADKISGRFSLGLEGQMIEKGRMVRPVRGLVLAGTLEEFIKNFSRAANDIKFFLFDGNIGSPHFLVDDLTVSGQK